MKALSLLVTPHVHGFVQNSFSRSAAPLRGLDKACHRLDRDALVEKFGCPTLSSFEWEVLEALNKAREQKDLPPVQLGNAAQVVARVHLDAQDAGAIEEGCAALHSWTDGPLFQTTKYKKCCYPKHYDCMWNKPQQIWGEWVGFGYELSARYSKDWGAADELVSVFSESQDHSALIYNMGDWEGHPWTAVGVAVQGGLANLWFMDGEAAKEFGYCEPPLTSGDD
eukprot:Gregarina_sp_Poly_1__9090@NODE_556_length_7542_cov_414_325351_g438_i0_p4_GENE_NODE_556_length_7542_cov_414_325351_g438_i0NODE_556_length_7542_cov_414_325351_g438_i0_p4_ORF_typecomplete_len224_score31_01CAP/PF00188_26/0_21_NODE_556_length_7542_cov_414_325351_g438_i015912262